MIPIRVAIAEDQLLFRKGMIALINTFDDMAMVLETNNGRCLTCQCQN
jgi:DNA-binding NarL/FixJ family response regulator